MFPAPYARAEGVLLEASIKRRQRSKLRLLLNALAFLGTVAGILFILGTKSAEPDAAAAPPPKKPIPTTTADAGAEPLPAVADRPQKEEKKEPAPFHPGAGRFKSPFARATPGPSAKAKVGILLNTVDGYDVKTGTFTADFFLSLTSTIPMPPGLNMQFPNGTVDK